jgi:hypothetical protein
MYIDRLKDFLFRHFDGAVKQCPGTNDYTLKIPKKPEDTEFSPKTG